MLRCKFIYRQLNGRILYPYLIFESQSLGSKKKKKKMNKSLSIYFSEMTEREREGEDFHRWNERCGKKRLDRPRKKKLSLRFIACVETMLGRLLNETATRNGNRCFSRRPFVLEKTFKRHQRIGLEKYSKIFILYTRASFFDRVSKEEK